MSLQSQDRSTAGAMVRERPPGQPEVADLLSNITLIAQPVRPQTAGKSGLPLRAGSLEEIVREEPPELEFEVEELPDLAPASGEPAPVQVTARMRYGADDPARVLDDFTLPGVIARMQRTGAEAEASQIDRRVLLRQRLQSVFLEDLLERLNDRSVASLVSRPEARKALLAAIDAEIERLEAHVADQRARQALAAADEPEV